MHSAGTECKVLSDLPAYDVSFFWHATCIPLHALKYKRYKRSRLQLRLYSQYAVRLQWTADRERHADHGDVFHNQNITELMLSHSKISL